MPNNYAEEIRQLAEKHEVTAYRLEQATGVSRVGIGKILDGTVSKPQEKTALKLLTYLRNFDNSEQIGNKIPETGYFSVNEPQPDYSTKDLRKEIDKIIIGESPYSLEDQHRLLIKEVMRLRTNMELIREEIEKPVFSLFKKRS